MEKLENEIFEVNPRFDNYLKILECIYEFEVNNLQNREKSEHESVIGFYNAIKNKDLRVVYNSSIIHNEEYGEICAIQTTEKHYVIYAKYIDEFNYIVENLKQPYIYLEIKNVQDTKPYLKTNV